MRVSTLGVSLTCLAGLDLDGWTERGLNSRILMAVIDTILASSIVLQLQGFCIVSHADVIELLVSEKTALQKDWSFVSQISSTPPARTFRRWCDVSRTSPRFAYSKRVSFCVTLQDVPWGA